MKGQDRQKRAHYFVKQLGLLRYQRRCNWFCVDLSSKIDAIFLISAKPIGQMTNNKSLTINLRLWAGRKRAPEPQLTTE